MIRCADIAGRRVQLNVIIPMSFGEMTYLRYIDWCRMAAQQIFVLLSYPPQHPDGKEVA